MIFFFWHDLFLTKLSLVKLRNTIYSGGGAKFYRRKEKQRGEGESVGPKRDSDKEKRTSLMLDV